MVMHYMITFLYTVKLLSRVSTQKLTCRTNTLRKSTLNGITFLMTKKCFTLTVITTLTQLLKYGLMYFHVICSLVMTLPITKNLTIFTVVQLKASMYQLFQLIKGLNLVTGKFLDRIGTAETWVLMAVNTFLIGVEMVVRVIMNF